MRQGTNLWDSCGWIQSWQREQARLQSFPSNCLSIHWCCLLQCILQLTLPIQDLWQMQLWSTTAQNVAQPLAPNAVNPSFWQHMSCTQTPSRSAFRRRDNQSRDRCQSRWCHRGGRNYQKGQKNTYICNNNQNKPQQQQWNSQYKQAAHKTTCKNTDEIIVQKFR